MTADLGRNYRFGGLQPRSPERLTQALTIWTARLRLVGVRGHELKGNHGLPATQPEGIGEVSGPTALLTRKGGAAVFGPPSNRTNGRNKKAHLGTAPVRERLAASVDVNPARGLDEQFR